jgi:DNA-binding transcriptional regulator YhcF (GntR family)
VLQPESENQLTKEILFQILDSYFKNNDILLSTNSYANFIKNNRRSMTVSVDGQRKNATGILFNGQLYPVPNELRTDKLTGNRKFDLQAMEWLREYRRTQQNIQGTTDKNTKYLWEADDNTLTEIIKNIIQQMVKAEMNIDTNYFNNFVNKYLPKIEHITNDRINYIPYVELNKQKYLIYQINKRIKDVCIQCKTFLIIG